VTEPARSPFRALLVAVALSCAPAPVFAQDAPPSFAARLEALRTASSLPAVGGARFTSAGITEVAVTGLRKVGDTTRVTAADLWHIGSITKSFTALLVGRFVERGDLAWTTTLRELIGDRAGAYGEVTLAHLLSHRAGLAAAPAPALLGPMVGSSEPIAALRKTLVTEVLKVPSTAAPGTAFLYSNLGYVVVGAALEERSGRSWEELVRDEVIAPLGLASAGQGAPGVAGAVSQPRGHRGGTVPLEPDLLFADNLPYLGPAGRLHMSITDLARWGQEHLAGARGRDGLVRAGTFDRLITPDSGRSYAMGWVSQTTDGRRVIWHNGSNTLWYAIVAFDPAADRGVVIVTNGGIGAARAVDAAALAALGATP
jgi:CubicO group peptidase (beta-lactamase class C family)